MTPLFFTQGGRVQEIKHLKTRNYEILCDTIRDMSETKKGHQVWDLYIMMNLMKRIPENTYFMFIPEIGKYVFTNILDDELVHQEYFSHTNFVIVETDACLALARGIHYRYHKKMRP